MRFMRRLEEDFMIRYEKKLSKIFKNAYESPIVAPWVPHWSSFQAKISVIYLQWTKRMVKTKPVAESIFFCKRIRWFKSVCSWLKNFSHGQALFCCQETGGGWRSDAITIFFMKGIKNMDFENFKEKFMEDIKERLEDAGIDAKITTNAVKKLTRGMASRICWKYTRLQNLKFTTRFIRVNVTVRSRVQESCTHGSVRG